MKQEKRKKSFIEIISPITNILIMLLFLVAIYFQTRNLPNSENEILDIIYLVIGLSTLAISLYIHTIIHEIGHLIFGLLSGYKFTSFRIGTLILVKQKNKYKFKKFSLPGTAGQCLMSPPELVDNKTPVFLFNLGGVIMNIIFSILLHIISTLTQNIELLSYCLEIIALVGLLCAAQNGIPMKTAEIDNDGLNAFSLNKHKDAQKAFWIQLKVNEEISNGKRLKDMPDEWFEKPKDKDMKNSMLATIAVFHCNRLMDEHNFDEASKQIKHLIKIKNNTVGIHKNLLINDLIYCNLLEDKIQDAKKLLTPTQKNFMNVMKDYPAIIRTEYAIASLLEKNKDKANEIKRKFIARGKTYPYPADIKSEKELIDIITNINNN